MRALLPLLAAAALAMPGVSMGQAATRADLCLEGLDYARATCAPQIAAYAEARPRLWSIVDTDCGERAPDYVTGFEHPLPGSVGPVIAWDIAYSLLQQELGLFEFVYHDGNVDRLGSHRFDQDALLATAALHACLTPLEGRVAAFEAIETVYFVAQRMQFSGCQAVLAGDVAVALDHETEEAFRAALEVAVADNLDCKRRSS
ncbi:MAG: hypothetical protein AAFR47_18160 [Pseudomonadota bacterium]